ncbi:MAG: DUF927 domain-containing protein [Magnetococcus sp. YQC-5]
MTDKPKVIAYAAKAYPGKAPILFALRFRDFQGRVRTTSIMRSDVLNLGKIKTVLVDAGMPTNLTDSDWQNIQDYLKNVAPARTIEMVPKTGLYGNEFVLKHAVIRLEKFNKHELNESFLAYCAATGKSDSTLEEWQEIPALALHSPVMMLSLSAMFAGPLLKLVGIKGGGIHLYSKSSDGKSTIMLVCASVIGPPAYVKSWKFTQAAVEEVCAGHNALTLLLDELKLLHKNKKIAAEMATAAVYDITQGTPKARHSMSARDNSPVIDCWDLMFLSAGEYSMAAHSNLGGQDRLSGEEVRLIDQPSNMGKELGVFKSLPEGITSFPDFCKKLDKLSGKHYGIAFHTYIKHLLEDISDAAKKDELLIFIATRMDAFFHYAHVNRDVGVEKRRADKYALIYAAATLAIRYKILPWKRNDALKAIAYSYKQAVMARPMSAEQEALVKVEEIIEAVRKEIAHYDSQEKLIDSLKSDSIKVIRNPISGCYIRMARGERIELLLTAGALEDSDDLGDMVLEELDQRGFLLTRLNTKLKQVRIKSDGKDDIIYAHRLDVERMLHEE